MGMPQFPGVGVSVSSNNLLRSITVLDSVCALVMTVKDVANIGVVRRVFSLADAVAQGYTETEEPFAYNLISQYYAELGGNQLLYLLGTDEADTMAQTVDVNNSAGLKLLFQAGGGNINLVGIAREPGAGYNGGTDFLDADVQATVLAAKPIALAQQSRNAPFRLLIGGRVVNEDEPSAFEPTTASNGFAGVVVGSDEIGVPLLGTALGRASAYAAHVKLGNGLNGPLSVSNVYIGTQSIDERLDMEIIHGQGFMTFHRRPGQAGYYFGRDNMAAADDFRILAHGRVIDKAQRITAAAYAPYVETSVRLEADGSLNSTDAKHLEDILLNAVRSGLSGQISDARVVIDPIQDIVNTSELEVGLSILPLGYLTWIHVTLGLTASLD